MSRMKAVAIACAMALVIAATVSSEALGHFAAPRSGVSTPSWLGDIPGLGAVAPDPPRGNVPVRLAGCNITNPLLKDDPARVRRFVPAGYKLGENAFFGPGVATTIAAYMPCTAVRVDGGRARPAVLSLIAVQVRADPIGTSPVDALYDLYNQSTLNFLPSSSWYLLAAQTNNNALATRLRHAGLPIKYTPGLVYHSDYNGALKRDSVLVPTHAGSYRVATTTMLGDVFTHNHDWFFWHGPRAKRTGFLLHLHAMDDSSCGYHLSPFVQIVQPSCGATLAAEPGSRIANFLGGSARSTPYAFNHPPSHARGYIDLPPNLR